MNEELRFENRCERIRRLIFTRPGITGTELALATKGIGEFDRKDAIALLVERGDIRVEVTPTGKRPRRTFWPVERPTVMTTVKQPELPRPASDPNPATMTVDEIRAFNEQRRKINLAMAEFGCPLFPLLPLPS